MAAADALSCFKAYDIRGELGTELNEDIAYRIGYAYAKTRNASTVVVGGDIRHSSETLKYALAHGLIDAGAHVIDIGMVGTEEIYFAAFYLDVDGGIEVTASHNPINYNGMKLVGRGATPISGDSGLHDIKACAQTLTSPYKNVSTCNELTQPATAQLPASIKNAEKAYSQQSILEPYIKHLLSFIDKNNLKPLKLVVNAGNGAAGHVIDALEKQFAQQNIPISFIKIHHEPDGAFPNGIPNPLLPENRAVTAQSVTEHQADFGIAWDGDFDRCFFFDENARFIEGYYIVGLLAEAFLRKHPNEKIIHDPRLTWNTIDQVQAAGGRPVQSKTGHAFIKERMRLENAIYGGEMSAHHYFRDFAFCDSGMLPWLLVGELLGITNKPLSALVDQRMAQYPCSGEINFRVTDIPTTLERITEHYTSNSNREKPKLDYTDGISLEFHNWRFNLRGSNTEPLIRLNLETRGDADLVKQRLNELESIIRA